MRIGNVSLFNRASDGSIMLASYQKPNECWRWAVSLGKRNGNRMICRAAHRTHQWHDNYNLGRWSICISRQDYHLRPAGA
ncbi:hypothetical protein [Aquamicrobium defluvii]|uniref:Uncharacterized protein n=1 Tax=Aquamicrobium defluvii TaxID=69279 RepID=A0A4R6Y0T4_9HYPH|nr:hypothetical protein [Aquamicrobium defluvii]TDR28915.1 hypothetical protein DES43_1542 [Aquamicrobium defluvii]